MRHGEIALGVEYAYHPRRMPLGNHEVKRVVVDDAEKKWARGPNNTVVENWRSGMGGMKGRLFVPPLPVDIVVQPGDLIGTWTEHLLEVKANEKRAREKQAAERKAARDKRALRKRLNAAGFDVVSNYGGSNWYVPTEILIQLLDAYEEAS